MKVVKLHSLDYLKEHYNNVADGIKNANINGGFMIVKEMFPLFENEAIIKIKVKFKSTTIVEICNTKTNKNKNINKPLQGDFLGWGIDKWMIEKEIDPEDYPEYFI